MAIFNFTKKNNDEEYQDQYDDSADTYEDPDYDEEEEEEVVSRFSEDYSSAPSSSANPAGEAPKYTHTTPDYSDFKYKSASSSASSSYKGAYGSSSSASSSNYSNIYKMPKSRKTVEELYIAELRTTSDALAVADLVKEKRFALIVNLNPLKEENGNAYSSVVNFIDGVCYVTDSEFKEINLGCGLFLIYHKDIVLNEGLGTSYYSSNSYR